MTDDAWFGVTPEPVAKYVNVSLNRYYMILTLCVAASLMTCGNMKKRKRPS